MRYFPCTNQQCPNKFHYTSECPNLPKGRQRVDVLANRSVPPPPLRSTVINDADEVEETEEVDAWTVDDTDLPPTHVLEDGTKEWRVEGLLHRNNGPARVTASGFEEWYQRDKKHRVGAPAAYSTGPNPSEWWYQNGLLHRDDGGPAFKGDGGRYLAWWFEGQEISNDHWWMDGVPPEQTIERLKAEKKLNQQ